MFLPKQVSRVAIRDRGEARYFTKGPAGMEDDKYWRSRASEMRDRAAHIRDPFVSGGFLALAEQYELLAQDGARWIQAGAVPFEDAHIEMLPEEPSPRIKAHS
jgi:hypothetical protein